MKEIKAYIRPERADDVIAALESSDVPGLTVIDVSVLGNWVDPDKTKLSMEYCDRYCSSVKIELICEDEDVEKFISKISETAHTGKKGDGKIFVSELTHAVSIRTGERGSNAI